MTGRRATDPGPRRRRPWPRPSGWPTTVPAAGARPARPGPDRHAYTGGAPLGPDVFGFFHAIGVNLKQIYGQTEICGIAVVHRDDDIAFTSVGTPIPGTELRISDDGEILLPLGRPCSVATSATRRTRRPRPLTPRAGCTPATRATSTSGSPRRHRPAKDVLGTPGRHAASPARSSRTSSSSRPTSRRRSSSADRRPA